MLVVMITPVAAGLPTSAAILDESTRMLAKLAARLTTRLATAALSTSLPNHLAIGGEILGYFHSLRYPSGWSHYPLVASESHFMLRVKWL
jgi:hypothetical protein